MRMLPSCRSTCAVLLFCRDVELHNGTKSSPRKNTSANFEFQSDFIFVAHCNIYLHPQICGKLWVHRHYLVLLDSKHIRTPYYPKQTLLMACCTCLERMCNSVFFKEVIVTCISWQRACNVKMNDIASCKYHSKVNNKLPRCIQQTMIITSHVFQFSSWD